ncbi:MAG: hypothetical protein JJU41_10460 [Bacteroidetes bacterium]|nr:hypothetical protein [Bacteroidota bacterium]MCH8525056.1 hypothetical protein [Balneolales bacterium]
MAVQVFNKVSYTWRVRNGGFGAWTQVSSSPTYWHTFTQAGTGWQVQLQVHNSVGRTHTRTITGIHVSNAPESQYYLTDHLGSVRAVVNRDGDLLSWSDYYPFGLPMPTRSANTANTHDMIKFTGYEAEDEGDLGWYHAESRTYDPFIGRFNSVDPHASNYPGISPYAYVANNPVISIDPDGRDIWFVHGTLSSDITWTQIGLEAWEQYLNDDRADNFNWSGANTHQARVEAAEDLVDAILEALKENPEMEINIVAHSHGGNVGILAANMLSERTNGELSVDNLITIGTPSRDEYRAGDGVVGNHVNIFSNNDAVQVLGGYDTYRISSSATGLMFIGLPAGRIQPGARNVNATQPAGRNPIRSHSQMHNNVPMIRLLRP